jgi:hypothetical protein
MNVIALDTRKPLFNYRGFTASWAMRLKQLILLPLKAEQKFQKLIAR